MLVSKDNIKIVLLLIFILVIYQISKTSPNNYLAYLLISIGFYLVYTEVNVLNYKKLETMNDDQIIDSHIIEKSITPVDNNIDPQIIGESIVPIDNNDNTNNIDNTNDNMDELINKAKDLEDKRANELNLLKKSLTQTNNQTDCDCNKAINKALAPLQAQVKQLKESQKKTVNNTKDKIKNYKLLIEFLEDKGVLKKEDIENLQSKLTSKLLTIDEVINRLDKMKTITKDIKTKPSIESNKNWQSEMNKSELPSDMYLSLGSQINSDFSNDYTILNSEKWTVPMPRPPVCINSAPKEIMPVGTSGYPLNVKYFDEARYVSTSASQEKQKKEIIDKLEDNLEE